MPDRVVQRLGVLHGKGTKGRQFAEQDHLHPGEPGHDLLDLVPHRRDIFMLGGDMHLNACDREWGHGVIIPKRMR